MATFTITVSTMARRVIYTGGNQGTIYELDATITYEVAGGALPRMINKLNRERTMGHEL